MKKKVIIIYISLLILITVMVTVTYFSYAFLIKENEYHGKINMVTGTLDYKIESSELDSNNSITLSENETKKFEIEITNLNPIETKYELYYIGTNVEVGYSSTTANLPVGNILANGTNRVLVRVTNISNSSNTVTFGVIGGYTSDDTLTKSEGTAIPSLASLCNVTLNTAFDYDYNGINGATPSAQTFTVPCYGEYKIELWGASGGSNRSLDPPGLGAYVSGIMNITSKDTFYIYVGNQGTTAMGGGGTSSYNGGGTTGYYSTLYEGYGGGATDIRTVPGTWNDNNSLRSRIMVAAGGGGGGGSYSPYYLKGGHGGGLIGTSGTCTGTSCNYKPVTGATQTGGGYNEQNNISGSFGISSQTTSSNGYSGGGGSGWYAGVKGYGTGGSGGSSYISGHTGCVAVSSTTSSTPKAGCTTGTTNLECSTSPYGYIFTNTNMIDGAGHTWTNTDTGINANNLMPMPTGGNYASGIGHSGNGHARITYIAD